MPRALVFVATCALFAAACGPNPSSGGGGGGSRAGGTGGAAASGGHGSGGNVSPGSGGAAASASGGDGITSGGAGSGGTFSGGGVSGQSGGGGGRSATGGAGAAGSAGRGGGNVDAGDAGTTSDAAAGDGTIDRSADGSPTVDGTANDSSSDRASSADAAASSDRASADAGADPLAVDVYLIGGQSNATGQGYIKNYPPGLVPNVNVGLYHSGAPHLNSGAAPNTWIPLRQASESPDRFGPEIGFGNEIQRLYPARKIYLIKHAHSGTNLFSDWAPGAGPTDSAAFGPQFQVFVATVEGGLKGLRDKGLHPIIRGMLWQQGESDADVGGTTAQQYGQRLNAFIKRVRQQWSSPAMLFIYGYVYPPPNAGAGRDAVRLGERNVDQDSGDALAVAEAFVVLTDDLSQRADDPGTPLPNDRIHFGSAGQLELGKRMATKMHDHLPLP